MMCSHNAYCHDFDSEEHYIKIYLLVTMYFTLIFREFISEYAAEEQVTAFFEDL